MKNLKAIVGLLCLCIAMIASARGQDAHPDTAVASQIADQINAYRTAHGLAAVPVSKLLTKVAETHVADLVAHHPDQPPCNEHSWSASGHWTALCYTGDPAQGNGMWSKPKEIAGGAYPGNGYEIAFVVNGAPVTAGMALDTWKKSPGHNSVILELNTWQGSNWKAMGVGVEAGYAVVWFGKEADTSH